MQLKQALLLLSQVYSDEDDVKDKDDDDDEDFRQ